jgi:hypothetical protein
MPEIAFPNNIRTKDSPLAVALAHLEKVVVDGLRHGFFEYVIACEIGNCGKRQLVIRAGKSHKFVIPVDDLPH